MRTTVADLIEILKRVPSDLYWHGWDDESLILTTDEDGLNTYGWIEPDGQAKKHVPKQGFRDAHHEDI